MRKLFTILACAAAMVACENDEIVRQDLGDRIEFGNAFVDNATRVDYSSTDVTKFNVYGTVNNVNIYPGTEVTKGGAAYGAAWTCPISQYWVEGANYKFAAVVDANNVNVDANGMPTSLEYAAAGQGDILYKYVEKVGKPKGQNDVVAFTFTHLLAKAKFTVTNQTNDSKYTYTVSNIKITDAYQNGVYTVNGDAGSWAGSDADETAFANIESVVYGTPKNNADMMLIPTANVDVSFDVTLYIDSKKVKTETITKPNVVILAANTYYNFNITLSPNDPIQFSVAAQPQWTAPDTNVAL